MNNGADVRLDEQTRNLLIELVKDRPILFTDCGDRSAELRDERQKLWDEIGEKINIQPEVCKIKFTNLKNNYFKNLRNDSVGPEMRRRLEFLDELAPWNRIQHEKPARITQRRSTKRIRPDYNEDSDSAILVNTSTTSVQPESTANLSAASNGVSNGHYNAVHSPKLLQFAKPAVISENSNNGESKPNVVNGSATEKLMAQWTPQSNGGEVDDLTSFFQSMEHTARKFNARLKVKVKRMISDIIYDAEEQWLNTQT
ncbi:uncharacterized protein LOC129576488 [Sitodiplosis mosellana]|uniref:uncharacterized protein LOC129576488 n=1 Tax=Sitodiplosis mosellana TaxID=263140 RepID=UPI002443C720|nr:uncharacterized protein LOC129576488 [Sitodiplosis mosellana]